MPYIKFTTTKTLTLHQEIALKEFLGQNISILPGKTEENVMIHIEDNQVMYFKGQEIECMKITVEVYKPCDFEKKKEFCEKLMQAVEDITGIPVDQQFLTYLEHENWGKKGQFD